MTEISLDLCVNQFHWHTVTLLSVYYLSRFHDAVAELSRDSRDHVAQEALGVYSLGF